MTNPNSSQGAPIRVRNVAKHYKDAVALDNVSLDIEAGEFITLLGASGSGKTTLLNIIAGFTKADTGTVEVDDQDLTTVPPFRRGLGMVFQHYALFPHMTVEDNVAFPLRRRKVPKTKVKERVQGALDIVELGQLGKRMPAQLSGGQQQRVALARALVFEPRVLLLDEPLGALDKRLREQLQIELKRLHRELGITFVFVTHDQEEALAMSDRIALLRDGRIVQVGTPDELYERPAELYAAEFLGESNVFTGTVRDGVFHDDQTDLEFAMPRSATGPGSVVIRPEKLRLGAPAPEGSANGLTGRVKEVIYLGSESRVDLDLDAGPALIARIRAAGPELDLHPGAPVRVGWEPDEVMFIPAEPAAAAGTELADSGG